MQWLARLCVKQPVFAAVLVLALAVAGIYSFFQLGFDQYPDVDVPTITVTTKLVGASPEEMDSTVTEEIEKQVNTVSSIDTISSVSSEGVSVVTIAFLLNKSTDVAFSQVQAKVNLAVPNLPTNIVQPEVQELSVDASPVITFALSAKGQNIRDISEYADKTLRPELESAAGVGQAKLIGGQLRQMNVVLSADRLRVFGLTPVAVQTALQAQNVEIPGGSFETNRSISSLRTLSRFTSAKDLGGMLVSEVDGQPIYLSQVARVEDTSVEALSVARLNGQNTVLLDIQKQSGSNTVSTVAAVKAKVAEAEKHLPPGYQIQITRDQSVFILASVKTVEDHLILGAVFAAIVVFWFLWDWRSTIIAAIAIPASIIATFTLIYALGFTLNTITLLALTLSVGIVIDDAILVLENIVRFMKEKNQSARKAAIAATDDIGLAVLATTLSLIALFLPIAFMSGFIGRFLNSFGLTIAFAIFISLIVAFSLTPMLASRWLKSAPDSEKAEDEDGYVAQITANVVQKSKILTFEENHTSDASPPEEKDKKGIFSRIEKAYWKVLRWSLHHRWVIVLCCIGAFLTIVPLFSLAKTGLAPNDDQSQFIASVYTPEGTSLQATSALMEQIATEIRKLKDVKFTVVEVGSDDEETPNKGSILVSLKEILTRKDGETQFTLMQKVRASIIPLFPPDVRIIVSSPSLIGSGSTQSDINYTVTGPDLNKLNVISAKMLSEVKKIKGVSDVDTTATAGNPEVQIQLLRQQAADLGVSATDIANTAQIVVAGLHVTDFTANGYRYDVNERAEPQSRENFNGLEKFDVPSTKADLKTVQMNQVAKFTSTTSPASINRYERVRDIALSVNIYDWASQSVIQNKIDAIFKSLKEGDGYVGQFSGTSKTQGEVFTTFAIALMLSLTFVYLILAAQFGSWLHPITILFSLPLSVPFALVSMVVLGVSINVVSLLGILVLFGVVKKNSILQVDHANTLRREGIGREQAVLQASRDRLRPILMTTLAFVAGMMPLAFARGVASESNHSAGDVIIGGQTLSLVLSLIATPVIYTLMDDLSIAIPKLKAKFFALFKPKNDSKTHMEPDAGGEAK